ncbi:MAG: OmpA family protein [Treponema sp.]|nr:OmpA family protein [Treponema sp.]
MESGYTYIEGTNPLVLDIRLVPLVFNAGYAFSIGRHFNVIPMLGAGPVFSSVKHYETAINMLLERPTRSTSAGMMLHGGVRAGWVIVDALTLYVGGGIDCVMETGGLIPLPALEAGFSIKPFGFRKKPPAAVPPPAEPPKPAPARAEIPAEITEEPAAAPEEAEVPETPEAAPAAETEPVRIVRVLYFPADSAVPVQSHLVELDGAGELLRSSPELTVRLRGYAAPYGTAGARLNLSEERVRFCADYLDREYGVDTARITVEWYGADRLPETSDGEEWRRRCVEIIIENPDLTDNTKTTEETEGDE